MNKILKAKIIEVFGTQSDFALVINEDETLISRVIRGRREIKPEIKKKWADALGCNPEAIFNTDEN
jgi:plasmid maintenance system antidote protein VapI